MNLRTGLMSIMAAGMATLTANPANAAGFFLQEQSVKASGRAFAGEAAMADDVSVMFYNPAGMTHLDGAQAAAGIYAIMPKARVSDTGTSAAIGPFTGIPVGGLAEDQGFSPQPAGYLYAAMPVSDALWMGLAVTVPFGLKDDYKDDYWGRYDSTKSEVMVVEIAPTIAYQITSQVSLGANIGVQRSTAKLISAIPNPLDPAGPNAASDGSFAVDGDDWSIGFTVGVLVKASDRMRVGLSYRSAVDHRLKGEARTDFLGSVTAQDVAADLNLPEVISAAVAYDVTPAVTLLAQVNYYGWDRFEEIRLELEDGSELVSAENFRDTWGVSFGVQVKASEDWTLRSGIEYDETPTVDEFRSTRIPDANRLWLAVGASYDMTDHLTIDLSYVHMFKKTEPINRTNPFPLLATTVETVGSTDTSSNVVGVGLRGRF